MPVGALRTARPHLSHDHGFRIRSDDATQAATGLFGEICSLAAAVFAVLISETNRQRGAQWGGDEVLKEGAIERICG
jgi:hypothetical protein